jgi:endonuclease/exonuclease/phosphatase (EEP) superfamily protein YafD
VTLVTRVEVMSGPDITAASDHRPLLVDLWLGAPG